MTLLRVLDSADIHCPLGFTPYEWKSSFLMSACLCFCLQAFFFSSFYTMYPSPGQQLKASSSYSLCVYLSMCVCLKVSESQHLLQGRHQVSFTNALSAQSSTHPCDRVTHRNRYSVYNLRNSQVLSFDAFVSVCVGLCGLHFEYLLHYLNV